MLQQDGLGRQRAGLLYLLGWLYRDDALESIVGVQRHGGYDCALVARRQRLGDASPRPFGAAHGGDDGDDDDDAENQRRRYQCR